MGGRSGDRIRGNAITSRRQRGRSLGRQSTRQPVVGTWKESDYAISTSLGRNAVGANEPIESDAVGGGSALLTLFWYIATLRARKTGIRILGGQILWGQASCVSVDLARPVAL
jgi:hypothetical protein